MRFAAEAGLPLWHSDQGLSDIEDEAPNHQENLSGETIIIAVVANQPSVLYWDSTDEKIFLVPILMMKMRLQH